MLAFLFSKFIEIGEILFQLMTMMIPSSKISSVALTKETIEEFREIFLLADVDSSGVITKKELGKMFETIGIHITEEELHSIVQSIDTDSNEEISFEEFVTVMTRRVSPGYSSKEVKDAFKLIQDLSSCHDGQIHDDTLVKYLTSYCSEKMSEERAKTLVLQMATEKSCFVSYEEYVDMMMNS